MGREVRRVPLEFDWPTDKVWEGFLSPERLDGDDCPDCKGGYSPHARHLFDLWYGYVPFDPVSTGSTPLRPDSPAVRAFAERNVSRAPEFYGTGEFAIVGEARRLTRLWNGQWSHHLSQNDVNALIDAGRLRDLTHTWSDETRRLEQFEPPIVPTAEQVNEWSLFGMGHDAINASVVIRSRCKREVVEATCPTCEGHGSVEVYPGQRAEAEAWEPTDPPEGEGWQLWETVTEGSPISPVFDSADGLAAWMSDPDRGRNWVPMETARKFIDDGWAPTFVGTPEHGLVSGVEHAGRTVAEG